MKVSTNYVQRWGCLRRCADQSRPVLMGNLGSQTRSVARRPCLIQQRMMIGQYPAVRRRTLRFTGERRQTDMQAVNGSDATSPRSVKSHYRICVALPRYPIGQPPSRIFPPMRQIVQGGCPWTEEGPHTMTRYTNLRRPSISKAFYLEESRKGGHIPVIRTRSETTTHKHQSGLLIIIC